MPNINAKVYARIEGAGSFLVIAVDALGNFTIGSTTPAFSGSAVPVFTEIDTDQVSLLITRDSTGAYTSTLDRPSSTRSNVPIIGFASSNITSIIINTTSDTVTAGAFSTTLSALLVEASGPLATLDPAHAGSGIFSGGNLTWTSNTANWQSAVGTVFKNSGSYYCEIFVNNATAVDIVGLVNASALISTQFPGFNLNGLSWANDGRILINSAVLTTINSWTTGDVLRLYFNITAKTYFFAVNNGNWNNNASANPDTGVGGLSFSTMNAGPYAIAVSPNAGGDGFTVIFGGAFNYTMPTTAQRWGRVAPTNTLFVPPGATALYSVRRYSGYFTNSCIDVRDSTTAITTIGFVNDICDFATIAALPQPVTISKMYDQSGAGHDATQATVANQPSINGPAARGFLFDGLVAGGGASNVTLKTMTIPVGAAFNENAFTTFMAVAPKTSIWNDAFFTFDASASSESMYTFQDTTTNAAGRLQGITAGPTSSFATTNIPAVSGSVLGLIGNGTVGTAIVDGLTTAFTVAAQALTGGVIGTLAGFAGFAGSFNMYGFVHYASVLSAAKQAQVQAAFNTMLGIPAAYTGQILCDGDSITYGYGGTLNQNWTRTLVAAFPSYKTYSLGVPGQQMATMQTVAAARVAARFNGALAKNILVLWAGSNDIAAFTSAASTYAALQSETATAKTAGFKVVWVTMLPRTDLGGASIVAWNAYNALIRGATLGQSNTADVLADVQANATMGPLAAAADHALYINVPPADFSVGVHPTDLGNSIVAPYIIAAVQSL